MTLFVKAIIIVLLSLPPFYKDKESTEDRTARMEMIARSIERGIDSARCEGSFKSKECVPVYGGSRTDMAAMLGMTGMMESAFALHVHQNKCDWKSGECDSGRARTPWQFQRTSLAKKAWWAYKGADQASTDGAAEVVVQLFARGIKGCGNWKGAISTYATGGGCQWKQAQGRYDYFLRLRTRAQEALKKLKAPSPPPKKEEGPKPIAKR